MVIFVRCNDVSPDPRLQKYIDYFEENNLKYKIIAWDRLLKGYEDTEKIIYFRKYCPFGQGVKNLMSKLAWMIFIIKNLVKYRKEYDVIHACDFDAALPSIIMKLCKKTIVFDVFDWIGQENPTGMVSKLFAFAEKKVANKVDYIIVCEDYRIKQLTGVERDDFLVMPNIPEININPNFCDKVESETFNLGYVGVFDDNRGLEELLSIVSINPDYRLEIAGYGKHQQLVYEYSQKFSNIVYHGSVLHDKGLKILSRVDLIVAFYFIKKCSVHLYAAPNKYYEATMLGIPIITNEGTYMSERIKKENIGIITEESYVGILKTLSEYKNKKPKLKEMGVTAKKLWNTKYNNVINDFLDLNYTKTILNK